MDLGAPFKSGGAYSGHGTCTNSSTFKCTVSQWEFNAVGASSYCTRQCRDSCESVLSQAAIIAIVVVSLAAGLVWQFASAGAAAAGRRRGENQSLSTSSRNPQAANLGPNCPESIHKATNHMRITAIRVSVP
jgi:hypothetical protein